MISRVLSAGNKVKIAHGQKKQEYEGEILEILEDEILKLSFPDGEESIGLAEKGWRLFLTLFSQQGIYSCNGEVTERYGEKQHSIVFVRLTSNLEKIQKRQFHYMAYTAEIEFRESRERKEEMWNSGTAILLSGDGCRFNSSICCPVKTVLELRFSGQDWKGRVMAVHQVPNRPEIFETRVEFLDSALKKREELIKFIFEEERKMQQKERSLEN